MREQEAKPILKEYDDERKRLVDEICPAVCNRGFFETPGVRNEFYLIVDAMESFIDHKRAYEILICFGQTELEAEWQEEVTERFDRFMEWWRQYQADPDGFSLSRTNVDAPPF